MRIGIIQFRHEVLSPNHVQLINGKLLNDHGIYGIQNNTIDMTLVKTHH
jgi:hypothetical protein